MKYTRKKLVLIFDKGQTRKKSSDMVLMAIIRAELKTSAEKELNILISGVNESVSEEEADKGSEDNQSVKD